MNLTAAEARAILGVPESYTRLDVLNAYRIRARMMHPDRFTGSPESEVKLATSEFQRLSRAKDVLLGCIRDARESRRPPTSTPRTHVDVEVAPTVLRQGGLVTVRTRNGELTKVRVRSGTADGAILRIPGRGPEDDSGHRADLFVRVTATRESPLQEVSVSVGYDTAQRGGVVNVRMPDGQTLSVRIPPKTVDRALLRVPLNNGALKAADAYARLRIRVPDLPPEPFKAFVRRRDAEDWPRLQKPR
ncbi:DnaJ C-terminal domain-containing protein [Microbacterium koreense]|uniref:DnaJ C-terminal domain-containing protein n=1 Tax=Microbacterium koreense TaxID=323761 RepID=A0ABW2ZRG1_9MICO